MCHESKTGNIWKQRQAESMNSPPYIWGLSHGSSQSVGVGNTAVVLLIGQVRNGGPEVETKQGK